MIIRVASLDPALSNFGMAKLDLDTDTNELMVKELKLIETERQVTKQIRQNSDDLRRATEIRIAYHQFVADCNVCFAEIPTGAQSARAMYAFGAVVGLLASCPIPLIQVQPFETKMATVGTKVASKEEMIEWANEAYPFAPWKRYEKDMMRKGKLVRAAGTICDDQEHLADAVAVAYAGVRTTQFQQLISMWRATAPRSAQTLAAV